MNKQVTLYKFLDRLLSLIISAVPKKKSLGAKEPKKILIIKLSAMGDCLSAFPSVRMLAEAFPNSRIDWLTSHRSNPTLFKNLKFIKETHTLPKETVKTLAYLSKFLIESSKYDLIIDYDQYYRVSELISAFGATSAGFKAPLKGKSFAISIVYDPLLNEKKMFKALTEEVLRHYKRSASNFDYGLPELIAGNEISRGVKDFSGSLKTAGLPILALYPGSSMNASFRRWPIERYIELSERLQDIATILFVGGKDEEDFIPKLHTANVRHIAISKYSLLDLIWLFSSTIDAVVGNDGGLLHIAESQKVPICGIFGPALYQKWGSINSKSRAIEINLGCRPCLQNYNGIVPNQCTIGTIECLTSIDVSRVEFETRKMLSLISMKAVYA